MVGIAPSVRFQSDIDGVRYMFCSDPEAPAFKVRVWRDGVVREPDGSPGTSFVSYWGVHDAQPEDQCWVVDWGATRVEIERPDGSTHIIY